MFPRRQQLDPETARQIERRLDALLAASPPDPDRPRRAVDAEVDELEADDGQPEPSWVSAVRSMALSRIHLGVVGAVAVLALLVAGWLVLRARPVALATPLAVPSQTSAGMPTSGPTPASPAPTASSTPAPVLVVHVLGAVRRPGLVEVPAGSRIADALAAAGGLRRDAAPDRLNLAAPVADGQQVFVGNRGHPAGEVRDGAGTDAGAADASGGSGTGGEQVNLNAATQAQLEELPGVGPVTATKIVAWRTEHGRFSRVEELQEVSGIGPKTYAEIAPHCRV